MRSLPAIPPLPGRLAQLDDAHPPDTTSSRPRLFDPSAEEQAASLLELIDRGAVLFMHDTYRQQVAGLIETREPARRLDTSESERRVDAFLEGIPDYLRGTWVYYPWSRRLVHVLERKLFCELRTSRNRNKITDEEQETLRGLCVAVAGLSVGQATAVTLALEEVGGRFRLADFDHLELSNLNRLRSGVHNLGVNKAVLTAREIYEINPYANVSVFTEGVTPENIDAFLDDVDMLFEECDDLYAKVKLREKARARRIPVVMETSDRGLIDVERYDIEPDRPVLHGLVEQSADELAGLTTYEKVPIVLGIIGAASISHRMAASLVDIETTLKTWPQLASAVALGGALNTDVARRMALGHMRSSGRFYVDLEELVSDEVDGGVEEAPSFEVELSPEAQRAELEVVAPSERGLSVEAVRSLVGYAAMAPSGGNCQPWRFVFRDPVLYCLHDVERSEGFLDFEHTASYLALGAAVENITLAAPGLGLETRIQLFPTTDLPRCVAAVSLRAAGVRPNGLVELIARRVTNRQLGPREPLSSDERVTLLAAAAHARARLELLTAPADLDAIADVLAEGDRMRFLSPVLHEELMTELRWTREDVERTRDGIDVATLELTPTDLAGLRLISKWALMKVVHGIGAGRGLEKPTRKALDAASAVGLITVPGTSPESYFVGGRAMQRVWLTATAHGLAFQPMAALSYLFARNDAGGEGLTDAERDTLTALRGRFGELLATSPDRAEVMLFRVARAGPPTARALRRPVDEILVVDNPA